MRREHFDVIHAHWLIPQGFVAVIGRILTQQKQIPLLCTSHGGDLFTLRGAILNRTKRWIMDHSQLLTVVSCAMKKYAVNMGIAPEKVKVISMGVDLKHRHTPNNKTERDPNCLLFVGRLVEKKGAAILLQAMPDVLKQNPDARLIVAGSGPLEAGLRNLARSLNISDSVEFLGMMPQSHLPALYRQAAMAVFPFLVDRSGDQEGFGLVQVEAMGCGCPVIAGDLPAIHDTIVHQENGLLVPPGDPKSLARAIVMLLGDPALRDRLSAEGRKRMVERFEWEIVAGKYAKLYKKMSIHAE
jgi:glycosyltransferase involved in cell wall biosynthesis